MLSAEDVDMMLNHLNQEHRPNNPDGCACQNAMYIRNHIAALVRDPKEKGRRIAALMAAGSYMRQRLAQYEPEDIAFSEWDALVRSALAASPAVDVRCAELVGDSPGAANLNAVCEHLEKDHTERFCTLCAMVTANNNSHPFRPAVEASHDA